MKIFKSKNILKPTLENYLSSILTEDNKLTEKEDELEFLILLVEYIRPQNPQHAAFVDISELLLLLKTNDAIRNSFSKYLKTILLHKKFHKILSDAAIMQDVDFIFEVKRRIFAKILPNQPQKDTLEFVLNQVFYLSTDTIWINKISWIQLEELYDLLSYNSIYDDTNSFSSFSELICSMNILSQRNSGRAMEAEVMKMVPDFDGFNNPFVIFEKQLLQIEDEIIKADNHYINYASLSYDALNKMFEKCEDFVEFAFKNSSKYGISLRVNQNLLKIRQQLNRLKVLIPLLVIKDEIDIKKNGINLTLQLITYNCYKNNVRKFVSESTQLISYEITQHTAKTGEHYITITRSEYFRMFRTALGGGLIVGVLCVIKILLGTVKTSFFGHAFLYSMNYSFGFITIFLLGFTLATKQPAMTASALVRALEEGGKKQGNNNEKYGAFAILFARVFRSQFVAFVGNVIMAFPVALLGIWLIDYIFHFNIAAAKWQTLITDISPIHSLAIFHSAIAGVFLFLSGIISGSVSNRDKYAQIYFRIQENPLLKKSFGKQRVKKLATWYEKRWAGIVSNFWFGVFMGSTASIGLFLGLNLDIRHITFASGNLALSLYGSNYKVEDSMLFWGIFGVGIIGLINFLVSFGLSLGLAFRSRNISIFEMKFVLKAIWKHFKREPFSFLFPIEKKQKSIVEENYLQNTSTNK